MSESAPSPLGIAAVQRFFASRDVLDPWRTAPPLRGSCPSGPTPTSASTWRSSPPRRARGRACPGPGRRVTIAAGPVPDGDARPATSWDLRHVRLTPCWSRASSAAGHPARGLAPLTGGPGRRPGHGVRRRRDRRWPGLLVAAPRLLRPHAPVHLIQPATGPGAIRHWGPRPRTGTPRARRRPLGTA